MSEIAEKLKMLDQEKQFRQLSLEHLSKSYAPDRTFVLKAQQAVLNFETADMLRINYIFDHLDRMDKIDIQVMQDILKPIVRDYFKAVWNRYVEDLGMPFTTIGEVSYETVLKAR